MRSGLASRKLWWILLLCVLACRSITLRRLLGLYRFEPVRLRQEVPLPGSIIVTSLPKNLEGFVIGVVDDDYAVVDFGVFYGSFPISLKQLWYDP